RVHPDAARADADVAVRLDQSGADETVGAQIGGSGHRVERDRAAGQIQIDRFTGEQPDPAHPPRPGPGHFLRPLPPQSSWDRSTPSRPGGSLSSPGGSCDRSGIPAGIPGIPPGIPGVPPGIPPLTFGGVAPRPPLRPFLPFLPFPLPLRRVPGMPIWPAMALIILRAS